MKTKNPLAVPGATKISALKERLQTIQNSLNINRKENDQLWREQNTVRRQLSEIEHHNRLARYPNKYAAAASLVIGATPHTKRKLTGNAQKFVWYGPISSKKLDAGRSALKNIGFTGKVCNDRGQNTKPHTITVNGILYVKHGVEYTNPCFYIIDTPKKGDIECPMSKKQKPRK